MRTPAHLCKERNALRSHPVSDHSMAKIIQIYEDPGNEYFEQNLILVHIDQVHPVEFVTDEIARNSVCIGLRRQIKTQTEQSQKHLVENEIRKAISERIQRCDSPSSKRQLAAALKSLKTQYLNTDSPCLSLREFQLLADDLTKRFGGRLHDGHSDEQCWWRLGQRQEIV